MQASLETPVGLFTIRTSDEGVIGAGVEKPAMLADEGVTSETARRYLDHAIEATREYFDGSRRDFDDLTLAPKGTKFQMRVWQALCEIPYGVTMTYGELATKLGDPGASRAVGMANNKNPIGVIIPCHRVIGAGGKLVGYASGLPMKKWLLNHEDELPLFR